MKKNRTMLHIMRSGMLHTVCVGALAIMITMYMILGHSSKKAAQNSLECSLNYLANKIEMNEESKKRIKLETQKAVLSSAYALQQIVKSNSEVIKEKDILKQFCEEQEIKTLRISDKDGNIIASIPDTNEDFSYNTSEEYKKYMNLIHNKKFVILDNLHQRQDGLSIEKSEVSVAVARLDEDGIIQLSKAYSMDNKTVLDALSIKNIAIDFTIGQNGFAVVCENEEIVSANNPSLVGKLLSDCSFSKQSSPNLIDSLSKHHYLMTTKVYKNYELYAFMPYSEVYMNRTRTLVMVLISSILIFLFVYIVIMNRLKKNVIYGIIQTNQALQKITHGDLDVVVNVHNNSEFESLSLRINQMVNTLRDALDAKEEVITTVKQEKDKYRKKSHIDPLTGVYNRGTGQSRIEAALEEGYSGMFCIFDIDNFKQINDQYGHMEGDQALVKIASVLTASFRPEDILMRLGGDEFAFFAKGIHNKKDAKNCINRFFKRVQMIRLGSANDIPITISLGGIIVKERTKLRFNDIYQKSDEALYSVKKNGKNRYCLTCEE